MYCMIMHHAIHKKLLLHDARIVDRAMFALQRPSSSVIEICALRSEIMIQEDRE